VHTKYSVLYHIAATCSFLMFYVLGWQWRNFVPYLCQLVFAAILWVKLLEMFVAMMSFKYALSLCWWSRGHALKLTRLHFILNNIVNLRPLTPHIVPSYTHKMANVCVAIDSMTSFHPIYTRWSRCRRYRTGARFTKYLTIYRAVIASLSKDRHKIVT